MNKEKSLLRELKSGLKIEYNAMVISKKRNKCNIKL